MEQSFITDIIQGMLPFLNNAQYEKLQLRQMVKVVCSGIRREAENLCLWCFMPKNC